MQKKRGEDKDKNSLQRNNTQRLSHKAFKEKLIFNNIKIASYVTPPLWITKELWMIRYILTKVNLHHHLHRYKQTRKIKETFSNCQIPKHIFTAVAWNFFIRKSLKGQQRKCICSRLYNYAWRIPKFSYV